MSSKLSRMIQCPNHLNSHFNLPHLVSLCCTIPQLPVPILTPCSTCISSLHRQEGGLNSSLCLPVWSRHHVAFGSPSKHDIVAMRSTPVTSPLCSSEASSPFHFSNTNIRHKAEFVLCLPEALILCSLMKYPPSTSIVLSYPILLTLQR